MGPDVKDTLEQLSKDVGSSMQMVVVTVVPTGYHRVAAYTMQSVGNSHTIGAETKDNGSCPPLSFDMKHFACTWITPHLELWLVHV